MKRIKKREEPIGNQNKNIYKQRIRNLNIKLPHIFTRQLYFATMKH